MIHFKVWRSSFRPGLCYFLGPIRSRVRVFNLSRNGAPGLLLLLLLLLLPFMFLSLQYINLDLSLHASARLQSAPETRKCTQLQTARPGRSRISRNELHLCGLPAARNTAKVLQ
jgi:hypothetical protein